MKTKGKCINGCDIKENPLVKLNKFYIKAIDQLILKCKIGKEEVKLSNCSNHLKLCIKCWNCNNKSQTTNTKFQKNYINLLREDNSNLRKTKEIICDKQIKLIKTILDIEKERNIIQLKLNNIDIEIQRKEFLKSKIKMLTNDLNTGESLESLMTEKDSLYSEFARKQDLVEINNIYFNLLYKDIDQSNEKINFNTIDFEKEIAIILNEVTKHENLIEITYNNFARLLKKYKEYDLAEKYYKKTVEIDPKLDNVFNNLGILCFENGRLDEANCYFQQAIEINSESSQYYNNLGFLLYNQSIWEESERNFLIAVKLDPGEDLAYHNLGNLYVKLNRFKEAEYFYNKALECNPNNETYAESLSELQIKSENSYSNSSSYIKF